MLDLTFRILDDVWEKAGLIPGMDPSLFRRDEQGSVIRKSEFNNESSIYGWCFNHLTPLWEGGNSELVNVTPLSCTNKLLSLEGIISQWHHASEMWD